MALKGILAKIDGTGTSSVALGSSSNASGNYSVAVGPSAKATSVNAISIGYSATGNGISIGSGAGASNLNAIAVGRNSRATGESSVALGYNSNATAAGATALGTSTTAAYAYSTAIGYLAKTTVANSIMLGTSNTSKVYIKGSIEITSDILDKIDIAEIEDGALNFINNINPITYCYNYRTDYQEDETWISQILEAEEAVLAVIEICNISKKERDKRFKYGGLGSYNKEDWSLGLKRQERMSVGFSAQEVKQILQETYGNKYNDLLVSDVCEKYTDEELEADCAERQYSMATGNLIPFLVKAIQELNIRINILKNVLENI